VRTEILKIIEGGLTKNPEKVRSYAGLLSEKLRADGDQRFADRISALINNKSSSSHLVHLDEFSSAPVDQDSRINMLDIWVPSQDKIDLVLLDSTRRRVEEYIAYLEHRSEFIRKGIELPESLLMYGPPGCGKTTIAHFIAQKTKLPLLTARLDGVVSSLLGSTAKNIRRIFEYANEKPCILFLDEFDAVAKARNDDSEVGELKRVVNSLLQNMDAFNQSNILIAATNHEQLLDPAVWRRFSNVIEVSIPDLAEISQLVRMFLRAAECDFIDNPSKMANAAKALVGSSPSDIRVVCYSAIRDTVLAEKSLVTYAAFMRRVGITLGRKAGIEDLVDFLHVHGVPQVDISRIMGVSIRQVRNLLELKKGVKEGS